jgi:hypothetical protein
VKIEYITDPVLVPGLRCPHCQRKVRQIRSAPSVPGMGVTSLIELLVWVVLAVAALVGYFWDAIFGLTLALLVIGPLAGLWLYLRDVRHSDFLCANCGAQLTYTQVTCKL